jgi:hypothetical protein
VEESKNPSFVEVKMAEGIFNLDLLLFEFLKQVEVFEGKLLKSQSQN